MTKVPHKDLFLNWDKFWPENRPTQADVDLIYKRKDRAPKQAITFADGTTEHLWNTFGEEQIDLDVTKGSDHGFYSQDHRTPGKQWL